MNSYPHSSKDTVCQQCGELFKGIRGLHIHEARAHHSAVLSPPVSSSSCPSLSSSSILDNVIRLRKSSRIIRRIPLAVRIPIALEFSSLLAECASSNTIDSWIDLLTFPHVAFNSAGHNRSLSSSLTTRIRENLGRWQARVSVAVSSASNPQRPPRSSATSISSEVRLARQVESKVSDGDIRGAVRLLASSEGISPFSVETLEALKLKHPAAASPIVPPTPPTCVSLTVDVQEVVKAIISFPPGSGGGPDGLRPQHLKDLTSKATGTAGTNLLSSLTNLINKILSGIVPAEVLPILFGASLIALDKKGGGIRPIAIGCTLRRIVGKLGCRSVLQKIGSLLRPHQMGFGTPCGTEAIVHATRHFMSSETSGILLKLDYANAFNSVLRSQVLHVARDHVPHLYPFILQSYGSPSNLFFGENLIASEEGLQQGDPLAPPLFCLAINSLVSSLTSPLNVWFLDDGTLGGPATNVLHDLKKVLAASSAIGLQLNSCKCELILMEDSDQSSVQAIVSLLPGIKILKNDECSLLGAPLTEEALPQALSQKVADIKLLTDRLPILSAHTALFLLKNCISIPKLMYLLRCSPTWKFPDLLLGFDEVMRSGLEAIVNVSMDDATWSQASLPVRNGGLGIRSASGLSVPAFLSSTASTLELVSAILGSPPLHNPDRDVAMIAWSEQCMFAPVPISNRQSDWEAPILKVISSSLLERASTQQDKARLLAVSRKESGAWLNAFPSPNLGTHLDNDTIRISVGLRLGIKLCHPHKCRCGADVDELGTHGLSCEKSAGRLSRHSAINDILKRTLATINVPSILEPSGIFRDDGKKPDGLSLIPWSKGKCLLWDATCADTLAPSYLHSTSRSSGSAALGAEKRKYRRYGAVSNLYLFCPFAVETLGPFGNEALNLVKELGRRLQVNTGEMRSTAFLTQRISIAIQRGNVASILATIPTSSQFHEIFDL